MYRLCIVLLLIAICLAQPRITLALPPPDVIAHLGSQFAQIFSILTVVTATTAGAIYRYFQNFFKKIKGKGLWLIILVIVIIAVSLAGTYALVMLLGNKVQQDFETEVAEVIDAGIQENDALLEPVETPDFLTSEDPNVRFIVQYYNYLGSGQIAAAYAMSKKNVPYSTYAAWYELVTHIEIESINLISADTYSVRVKLFEDQAVTTYGVLMTLANGAIASSEVRIIAADEESSFAPASEEENAYFEANKDLPLVISNDEFNSLSSSGIFVLDAREDEEYEIGHYAGSQHIRFADLLAGAWVSLPIDQTVYVICWSGIRGKEVTEFLRDKGIVARYLEDGASGWVNYGGAWEGGHLFSSLYSDARYTETLPTETVRDYVANGAVLVDARRQNVFATSHLPGSVNITIFFTPSDELERLLAQVPENSQVITICDDFVSCFDAKIAGVKLEKLGHTFLGRYTEPAAY